MNGWSRLAPSIAALAALAGLGCATAPFEAGCSSQIGSRTPAPLMWRAQERGPGGPSAAASESGGFASQERVQGGGVLYLLGSIHFGIESATPFGGEIEHAYARSDELVVEVDLSGAAASEAGAGLDERGFLEPPTKLADVLSPPTLERLEHYLDERGLQELIFRPVAKHAEFELFYDSIFFRRNEAMARRLAELARDGKTRFAVLGAGHMLGARGIPSLLCDRGFEVRRVSGGGRAPSAAASESGGFARQ